MESEERYEITVILTRKVDVMRLVEHLHSKGDVNGDHTHSGRGHGNNSAEGEHKHLGQNTPKRYRDVEIVFDPVIISDMNDHGTFLPHQEDAQQRHEAEQREQLESKLNETEQALRSIADEVRKLN